MSDDEDPRYDELSKLLDVAFREACETAGLDGLALGWVISWEVITGEMEDGWTAMRVASAPGQRWTVSRGLIEAARDHYTL